MSADDETQEIFDELCEIFLSIASSVKPRYKRLLELESSQAVIDDILTALCDTCDISLRS